MPEHESDSGNSRSLLGEILTVEAVIALLMGALLILTSTKLDPESFMKVISRDLGFALFVAVGVWAFFEVISYRRQQERLNAQIEKITKSVFFGVFRRELPAKLIEEASMLILEANVIRKDFSVTYTISDDTYETNDGDQAPYVRVQGVVRYRFKNIGESPTDVPISIGIPNPIVPGMKKKCDVTMMRLIYEGGDTDTLDLTEARKEMRQELEDNNKISARCAPYTCNLAPGEEVEVIIHHVLAKELGDTEVIQSLYATDGMTLTVIDRSPENRVVRARSYHRKSLVDHSPTDDPGTHIYSLDHHTLPHECVALWWVPRLAGEPEAGVPEAGEPEAGEAEAGEGNKA